MNVVGIYPQKLGGDNIIVRSTIGEPIGLGKMLAIAESYGHQIKYYPFIEISVNLLIEEIINFDPDICLFSLMTSQVNLAKEIASKLKQRKLNVIVICGGYHPGADVPIEEPFDIYVKGEGELTFEILLEHLEKEKKINDIPGISYKGSSGIKISNDKPPRIRKIDNYPNSVRNKHLLEKKYYGLIYPNDIKQKGFAYIEYGRGCLYNCNFCCKNVVWGNELVYRDPHSVALEMLELKKKYKVNLLFFCDLNFTMKEEKVFELCDELIKLNVNVSWFCMSNPTKITTDMLKIMKKAGCIKIMFGIESVSNNCLNFIHKPKGDYNILSKTAAIGILVHIFYVIGLPFENKKQILNSISTIASIPAHQIRICVSTPFPGSQWYNDLDKNLLEKDWALYDTENLIYKHKFLKPQDIDYLLLSIYKGFYLSPNYIEGVKEFLKNFKYYSKSFIRFFNILYDFGILTKKEKTKLLSDIQV